MFAAPPTTTEIGTKDTKGTKWVWARNANWLRVATARLGVVNNCSEVVFLEGFIVGGVGEVRIVAFARRSMLSARPT